MAASISKRFSRTGFLVAINSNSEELSVNANRATRRQKICETALRSINAESKTVVSAMASADRLLGVTLWHFLDQY